MCATWRGPQRHNQGLSVCACTAPTIRVSVSRQAARPALVRRKLLLAWPTHRQWHLPKPASPVDFTGFSLEFTCLFGRSTFCWLSTRRTSMRVCLVGLWLVGCGGLEEAIAPESVVASQYALSVTSWYA